MLDLKLVIDSKILYVNILKSAYSPIFKYSSEFFSWFSISIDDYLIKNNSF